VRRKANKEEADKLLVASVGANSGIVRRAAYYGRDCYADGISRREFRNREAALPRRQNLREHVHQSARIQES